MLFNSYIFILLFLPISLIGYFTLNKLNQNKASKVFLLAMSLWFYGYFNIHYLPIIFISVLINFLFVILLHKDYSTVGRRVIITLGVLFNISFLFYFKYYDFFISNINSVFGTSFNLLHLILPLGISFFTFQQVAYMVEIYRRNVPNYNILDYSLFVTFFPYILSGPIALHDEIIPQFADKSRQVVNYENLSKGIMAFAFGIAKKVLVADTFGSIVNSGYSNIWGLSSIDAIIVVLAYTVQIYFDFSGYCDMGIGIGLMFNIELPQNFNSPYKALTITDFWKRWHITLTRFLTRYVYIPLGGNRKGTVRTYTNVFAVYLISGLWHGANWTFVLWGILHGIAMVVTKLFNKYILKIPKGILWICTFIFINITWIFFRSNSLAQSINMIKTIMRMDLSVINIEIKIAEFQLLYQLAFSSVAKFYSYLTILCLVFTVFVVIFMKNTNEKILEFKPNIKSTVITILLLVWSIVSITGVSTFLYTNF